MEIVDDESARPIIEFKQRMTVAPAATESNISYLSLRAKGFWVCRCMEEKRVLRFLIFVEEHDRASLFGFC